MILNKHSYPRLYDDGSVEYHNYPLAHRFKNLNDFDYWYIEVLYTWVAGTETQKNFEDYIPTDIVEKLKSDDKTKLLFYSVEPIELIVENIYQYIILSGIPEHKILLMCELIDIDTEITRVANKYRLEKICAHYAPVDEFSMSHQLWLRENKPFRELQTLEKKKYAKSFINFNRRWRIHRPLFVSMLYCTGLLDKGYVSLGNTNETSCNLEDSLLHLYSIVDEDTKSLLQSHHTELSNLPDLYVDTTDLSVNLARLDELDNTIEYYKNSYFSVVSETCFFDNVGRFLTEKTFKTMAYKHPFILIAPSKSLEAIRNLKYKTFHPYIDESYDDEENHMKRLKMVLEETRRLAMLSEAELYDFIDNVKPIVKYNAGRLLTKTDFTRFNLG